MRKKIFLVTLNIILIILTTSCWNYSEMEDHLLVAGFAVDHGEGEVPYMVTAEVIIPESETSMSTALVQAEGYTILDALRNVTSITGKKLYLGHCRTMVICETIAKHGIADVLDIAARDHEIRYSVNIVVCKNSPAWKIYQRESLSTIKSYEIEQGLEENVKFSGKTFAVNIADTLQVINSHGIELLLPVVEEVYSADKPTFRTAGLAVFDNDKLVGFLTPEESKYVLLIRNDVKGGILLTKYQGAHSMEGKEMSCGLEVFDSKTKLKLGKIEDKTINFTVSSKIEAGLTNLDPKLKFNSKTTNQLRTEFEDTLENSIETVIERVQNEFGVDIFGFGLYIHKHKQKLWKNYESNWNDYFKEIKVKAKSEIKIRQSGLTKDTFKIGEKK